jgi:hypothetical protein
MSRYPATERRWVMRLLARMTPAERAEYERRCAVAPRHHATGRFYDLARARIAEQVMYEARRSCRSSG